MEKKPWAKLSRKSRNAYLSQLGALYGDSSKTRSLPPDYKEIQLDLEIDASNLKSKPEPIPMRKIQSPPRHGTITPAIARKAVRSLLPTEAEEQTKFVVWLKKLGYRPIVSANGGSRNYLEAAKLKRTGVSAGVPDVFLPIPSGHFHGLFIEMKRQKGGKVSAEQLDWLQYLRGQGFRAEVATGFEAAQLITNQYLSPTLSFSR